MYAMQLIRMSRSVSALVAGGAEIYFDNGLPMAVFVDGVLWVTDRYIPPRGGKLLGDLARRLEMRVVPHAEFLEKLAAARWAIALG